MGSRVKWLAEERYATKQFTGEKIPQEDINLFLETVRLAPSSLGLQPYVIHVVTDEKTKRALLPATFNQPQITSCSHLLVFCARTDLHTRVQQFEDLMKDHHRSPAAISTYQDLSQGFVEKRSPEQLLCWSQRQTYIAVGYAVLSAKDLGYDSCPMEGFDAEQYRRILRLPKHEHPTVLVALGVAADAPGEKIRFDDIYAL